MANFQDQSFTAKFICIHEFIHTVKVLFKLFKCVKSAWNKHIHFSTLYTSKVNVWWCSDVMCDSKTGPLAWGDTCHVGTHMTGPNGVPSSQVSLYSQSNKESPPVNAVGWVIICGHSKVPVTWVWRMRGWSAYCQRCWSRNGRRSQWARTCSPSSLPGFPWSTTCTDLVCPIRLS